MLSSSSLRGDEWILLLALSCFKGESIFYLLLINGFHVIIAIVVKLQGIETKGTQGIILDQCHTHIDNWLNI
jgi:hypothetical protein